MFRFKYVIVSMRGRAFAVASGSLLVALVVCASILVVASVRAQARAEKAQIQLLERLGTDLMVVREAIPSQGVRMANELAEGTHSLDGIAYTLTSFDDGDFVGRDFAQIGLMSAVCGTFDSAEVESLAGLPGVASVSGALLASCSTQSERTKKVEVAGVAPTLTSLSPREEAELDAAVLADPEYRAIAAEQDVVFAKPEPELTAQDHARLDELSDLLGKRREEIYHEKRPDIFAAPLERQEQIVTPEKPEVTSDSFLVAGIAADNPYTDGGRVVTGRAFDERDSEADVALVEYGFARARGISVGDDVTVPGKVYRVVGLVDTPLGMNAPDVFVPISVLQGHLSADGKMTILFLKATSSGATASLRKQVAAHPGLRVSDISAVAERIPVSVAEHTALIAAYGRLITGAFAFTAAVLLGLLGVRTIQRRAREIATLRAIGWGTPQVGFLCVCETVLTVFSGLVLGMAASVPALRGVSAMVATPSTDQLGSSEALLASLAGMATDAIQPVIASVPATADAVTLIVAVGVAIAIATVSSAFVLWRFSRIEPVALLRAL